MSYMDKKVNSIKFILFLNTADILDFCYLYFITLFLNADISIRTIKYSTLYEILLSYKFCTHVYSITYFLKKYLFSHNELQYYIVNAWYVKKKSSILLLMLEYLNNAHVYFHCCNCYFYVLQVSTKGGFKENCSCKREHPK
jgi:hypothetical protein